MNKAQRESLDAAYEEEKAKLPPMPQSIGVRVGCKVAWYEFKTEAEADIASQHAQLEAEYKSYFGYDFGYYQGGEVNQTAEGTWTVVFP